MNGIKVAFASKKDLLSVYYTAGYPTLNDTVRIAKSLEKAGVEMLEIGLPFSDPIADGPTIQESSNVALSNGMSLKLLFDQLKELRDHITIPVLLMGYINPVLQFGFDDFCKSCKSVGIDGLIIPDLPMKEYQTTYKNLMESYDLSNIFLITPQTDEDRIREIDGASNGFIYMVSSASITGARNEISQEQLEYFKRVNEMNLNSNLMIGFGISNKTTFNLACENASGAIIGSAFINQLKDDSSDEAISQFIKNIIT